MPPKQREKVTATSPKPPSKPESKQGDKPAPAPKPAARKPDSKGWTQSTTVAASIPSLAPPPPTDQSRTYFSDEAFDRLLERKYCGKDINDPINTAEDKWNLLPAFLKVKGLVKQHIDSFDHFLDVELKKIVKANEYIRSEVYDRFYFRYLDIYVGTPNRQSEDGGRSQTSDVTPNECRLRDMTYAAPIYVDIEYWRAGQIIRRNAIVIGRMPMMLKSAKCVLYEKSDRELSNLAECSVDPGGYFITKGQEKVILVQEQLSKNRVIVESAKGIVQASVTSSTHERKSKSYVLSKKGKVFFRHNIFTEDLPIVITMKALGVHTDAEIMRLAAGEDMIYQDLFAANFDEPAHMEIQTQQQALAFIGSKVKLKDKGRLRNWPQEALEALSNIVITHVPVDGFNLRPKALYLSFMARRVLMAMHDEKLVDDRDYVGNKRLELAGQMLSLLFEDKFKQFNSDFSTSIDKSLRKKAPTGAFDAYELFKGRENTISNAMQHAISTGNWNLKRFRMERAGVSHVLSRLSYISALGMMTRITSQFEKTRKVSGPRALQSSQFGMLCPSDTPEGEACGLVKNLALMTHITTEDKEDTARDLIFVLGAEDITTHAGSELYQRGTYVIFINGTPLAVTRAPKTFLNAFRGFRRLGRVSEFVSIHINNHHCAVHIATDEGRICRPLIVVENGRSKVTSRRLKSLREGKYGFDDFLRKGLVEYLDVNEENDSNIAIYEADITLSTTHLEIEPFTILGAVAGLIPYPHHNQSPRNTYQCAMGKQAIGAIAYNQFTRIDTLLFTMVYPQKPMVKTRAIELVKYDKLPAGQNAIVAVMSFSGYDIEDALVINKASIDRGFGRCQVFRKNVTSLKRFANGTFEDLGTPDRTKKVHDQISYGDGMVEVGARIFEKDIYMVKNVPLDHVATGVGGDVASKAYATVDMAYKLPDPCMIDKVVITSDEKENRIIKIQTRQTRRPEVGDKFSSRHGQKGVVGLIAESSDLPFSDEGITPDIIMNPHGFPSRMTVGKMLELVAGKAGITRGTLEYGTAFGGSKVEEMGKVLMERGFSYDGKDYMTCGITGEPLPAYIFFGPIYYQKLKHMVQDKMHSRATGPYTTLTRQPTEGRSRGGGLRLGEMERDCLIAYGASQLLLERLMLSSDKHECEICEACGGMGYLGWCQSCKSSVGVVPMVIPYAAKLLIQELTSMNIKASLKLEDTFKEE